MHACWEERKFQREQVGVTIEIYQDDFDLVFSSITEILNESGLPLINIKVSFYAKMQHQHRTKVVSCKKVLCFLFFFNTTRDHYSKYIGVINLIRKLHVSNSVLLFFQI